MSRVMSVTKVELHLKKSNPPILLVVATGLVSSGGWHDPALEAWRYIRPPVDRIQDFDFTATPPSGPATFGIVPIIGQAEAKVDLQNYWGPNQPLEGVRVHAQNETMLGLLSSGPGFLPENEAVIPWPWQVPL